MNNLEKYYEEQFVNLNCEYNKAFEELKNFPGYKICRDGTIWSNKINSNWRKLKWQKDHNGYYFILLLNKDGKQIKWKIHRLLATLFIPNPKNNPFVCHKDDNKENLSLDNLYWGTIYDNIEDAIKNNKYKLRWSDRLDELNEIDQIFKKYYPNYNTVEMAKSGKWTPQIQKEIIKIIKKYNPNV